MSAEQLTVQDIRALVTDSDLQWHDFSAIQATEPLTDPTTEPEVGLYAKYEQRGSKFALQMFVQASTPFVSYSVGHTRGFTFTRPLSLSHGDALDFMEQYAAPISLAVLNEALEELGHKVGQEILQVPVSLLISFMSTLRQRDESRVRVEGIIGE